MATTRAAISTSRDTDSAMETIDSVLETALARQLEGWRVVLRGGACRVGWKLGLGDRERIAGEIAIGHLTSATERPSGGSYATADTGALHADAELALRMGSDVAPEADAGTARTAVADLAAAVEIVDLSYPPDDPESAVAQNVFHRAVAFGPWQPAPLASRSQGTLVVNGEVRATAPADDDYGPKVAALARLLGTMGERLQAGDRIITGSIVQVPIAAGDHVVADLGSLGRAELTIE